MPVHRAQRPWSVLCGALLWSGATVACAPGEAGAPDSFDGTGEPAIPVGFFVTSRGVGDGGDLGGVEGADAHCAELAAEAGLPAREWRAFLSTSTQDACDRIGAGPWLDPAGLEIAPTVEALLASPPTSPSMLDEHGEPASVSPPPGREHDILTGSDGEGRWVSDRSCRDWRSNATEHRVNVGHHDWDRLPSDQWAQSWTTVHSSPCDQASMIRQFGTGRFYCFAAD